MILAGKIQYGGTNPQVNTIVFASPVSPSNAGRNILLLGVG